MTLKLHSERGHALYQGSPEMIAEVLRRHAKAINQGSVTFVIKGLQRTPSLLRPQGE